LRCKWACSERLLSLRWFFHRLLSATSLVGTERIVKSTLCKIEAVLQFEEKNVGEIEVDCMNG